MNNKPKKPKRIMIGKKPENQERDDLRNIILSNEIQLEARMNDARKPIFLTRYE